MYSTSRVSCLPFSHTDSISFRRCQSLRRLYVNAVLSSRYFRSLYVVPGELSSNSSCFVLFLAAVPVTDFRNHISPKIMTRYYKAIYKGSYKMISPLSVKKEGLKRWCRLTRWCVSKLQNPNLLGFPSSHRCIQGEPLPTCLACRKSTISWHSHRATGIWKFGCGNSYLGMDHQQCLWSYSAVPLFHAGWVQGTERAVCRGYFCIYLLSASSGDSASDVPDRRINSNNRAG